MVDDALSQAPLFAALDDEAAAALRASHDRDRRCPRGDVLFHEGDARRPAVRHRRRQGEARPRPPATAARPCSAILGPGEMFGELSPVRPRPAHRDGHGAHRRHAASALGHDRPAAVADRAAPRSRPSLLAGAGPTAAPDQRGDGRPGLLRRARPGRQGAAGPRRASSASPVTTERSTWSPRPHPGGARPAGRRLPRDGQQGARRLRSRGWLRLEPRGVDSSTSSGSAAAPSSPSAVAGRPPGRDPYAAGSRAGPAR